MRGFSALAISLLNGLTFAIPWNEPLPTPQGLLDAAGVSPRPTAAPGVNSIPVELRRRQQDVLYPPPGNWCGFIEGDYDNPLTCRSSLFCVNYDTAVGCCSNTLPGCTNVYTTCYDYGDTCDSDCDADYQIRKCSDSAYPYCGTYSFPIGTYLYNCEATANYGPTSVEQLSDFYLTAISSTIQTSSPSTSPSTPLSTSRITSSPSFSSSSSSDDPGLSANAVRGIAIGVSVGVCAIFILLAIFIVRRRRANRIKRASQPNLPPAYAPAGPMQLQQQNKVAYQPVPQQDRPYSQNPAGYFAPSAAGKEGATVTSQPSLSPGQELNPQHTSLLSPNNAGPGPSPVSGRDSIHGLASATLTEMDGSERPLPEADSIERPQSTHQSMVSPMQMGSSAGSPSPPSGHFMQKYGNPSQEQQLGQGQVNNGSMTPHAGAHEMPSTQPYLGPHEMPNERH
ncbi:MAG: hypothetical protein Q9196_002663 [Gyalolechia fulgens]